MFERLLLVTVIGATCVPVAACDTSEAAPSLPAPAPRDAGLADAGPSADAPIADAGTDAGVDAGVSDARVIDAPIADAGAGDAATIDAPPVDAHDILRDASEAPPLYDARILM